MRPTPESVYALCILLDLHGHRAIRHVLHVRSERDNSSSHFRGVTAMTNEECMPNSISEPMQRVGAPAYRCTSNRHSPCSGNLLTSIAHSQRDGYGQSFFPLGFPINSRCRRGAVAQREKNSMERRHLGPAQKSMRAARRSSFRIYQSLVVPFFIRENPVAVPSSIWRFSREDRIKF